MSIHKCTLVYIRVCRHVCTHVHIYTHVHTHVCTHVHTCLYNTLVYVHVHTAGETELEVPVSGDATIFEFRCDIERRYAWCMLCGECCLSHSRARKHSSGRLSYSDEIVAMAMHNSLSCGCQ